MKKFEIHELATLPSKDYIGCMVSPQHRAVGDLMPFVGCTIEDEDVILGELKVAMKTGASNSMLFKFYIEGE